MGDRPQQIDACVVCINSYCVAAGSQRLIGQLKERLAADASPVQVKTFVCFGACTIGPNLVTYPAGTWYAGVTEQDVDDVVAHLEGRGPVVSRLTERTEPSLHELILELLDLGLEE